MKIGLIITLVVAAFIALIVYSTFHGPRYRVEVCMAYQGRSACKTVSAKSEDGAIRSAKENACADISSGVTDTIRCQNTNPQSVKWLTRP